MKKSPSCWPRITPLSDRHGMVWITTKRTSTIEVDVAGSIPYITPKRQATGSARKTSTKHQNYGQQIRRTDRGINREIAARFEGGRARRRGITQSWRQRFG